MAGYTKEFLVDAFVDRYKVLGEDKLINVRALANQTYDLYGKDKFRLLASLDADAIKQYNQKL